MFSSSGLWILCAWDGTNPSNKVITFRGMAYLHSSWIIYNLDNRLARDFHRVMLDKRKVWALFAFRFPSLVAYCKKSKSLEINIWLCPRSQCTSIWRAGVLRARPSLPPAYRFIDSPICRQTLWLWEKRKVVSFRLPLSLHGCILQEIWQYWD